MRVKLKAAGTPGRRVEDTDEHLLRFFTTKSDGRGYGFFTSASLHIDLGAPGAKNRAFLALDGAFERMEADLSAISTWYGDDPIDAEDNTGWRIAGIPHAIRSSQYSLNFRFGYSF